MFNQKKNKFLPLLNHKDTELSDDDEDNMITDQEEDQNTNTSTKTLKKTTKKEPKPPPLVVHGIIKDLTVFHNEIQKAVLKNKYNIKIHADFTEVFTKNKKDHQSLIKHYDNIKVPYHTFTQKGERKRTYVIKGLHEQVTTDDIKTDLKEQGISTGNIFLMKKTRETKFLITTESNIQLDYLKQNIPYIVQTKISWEYYNNKKRITQCHRCQAWGHATINCHAPPSCLKCAKNHLTKDCTKSKDLPAECINCGKDHPANASICIAYKKRIDQIEATRTKNTKTREYKTTSHPNLKDQKSFPELKSTHQNLINTNQSTLNQQDDFNNNRNTSIPNAWKTASNTSPGINLNNTNSDFNTFLNEFTQLKKEIDIKEMINLVREFRSKLSNCKTKSDKFLLTLEFCQQLDG